jgi:hypothetical protein
MSEVKPDIIGLTASIIVWLWKQFKNESGIKEVITATHLQNKEGEKPYLIKEHKTETGKDYVFALPAGVDREDFEKNKHYFEAYTNSSVEIESKGRKLILKTHTKEFSKEIKYHFDPSDYRED